MKRLYLLLFLELASRRILFIACSEHPGGAGAAQKARSLAWQLQEAEVRPRFLIHDRDSNFSAVFDAVFRAEGLGGIRTPARAPLTSSQPGAATAWADCAPCSYRRSSGRSDAHARADQRVFSAGCLTQYGNEANLDATVPPTKLSRVERLHRGPEAVDLDRLVEHLGLEWYDPEYPPIGGSS